MTKYRLKDQELQKKLDEISDGEFSKNLHKFDENHFASYWGKTIFFTINEDDDGEELEESKHIREPQFGVWFNIGEIEEVPEYAPNDWNVFPDVTPPEGVMMRCIIKTPGRNLDGPEPELPKICARTSGVWDGRRWQFFGYGSLCEGSTVEYRTWE